MSIYRLCPSPNIGGETCFEVWDEGFTHDECDRIIEIGDSFNPEDAVVGNDAAPGVNSSIRISQTSWIPLNDDTEWIYNRLGKILRTMNGMYWRYDIHGFHEHLQYTVYDGSGTHYDWHVDNNMMTDLPPRKLSMSVQLSDPDDYDGGGLEISDGQIVEATDDRGAVIVFPSYRVHRVTPVTEGVRRSLVVWANGPAFR